MAKGNFRAGDEGTIQKRLCGREQECLKQLMLDPLRPYVPEYRGQIVTEDGEDFLQLQDLLGEFEEPCVMDCKIGVRTYQEDELAKAKEKPKLRKDMYDKMMLIDKSAPTDEEHRLKAVTKPRYMVWRETISSTATLGFRIEGIRKSEGFSSKDFKTTRSRQQVKEAVTMFTEGYPDAVFIGSSLLFVHDASHASVWMIDFAKTTPLPPGVNISHGAPWRPGNHEDGYLTGITSLMSILREMDAEASP
ncbi:Inositol-trisphosphate 3-kinase B [Amphibalanus amphitrite]|uniref:Kinase n=1 Tax=Amphibalanus amphitrite TaxID=1232801 RepID=A0A6A4V9H6_AMPAM|nr:Inositol-trisphosphate 3-kinase B [Amphibalanus amphitrite]